MSVHYFGIRHHGPGCARSLRDALAALRPDCILIEGPPEADSLIPLALHEDMRPPVALLIYVPDEPRRAAFYPFAEFSPEWQALRYGVSQNLLVRFIDLPQSIRLAQTAAFEDGAVAEADSSAENNTRRDPIATLAQASGYTDADTWWDHLVEEREDSLQLFEAIAQMMRAARSGGDETLLAPQNELEAQREAHMRQMIRATQKQGHERIAVVCGAYHVPALQQDVQQKHDADLLKGLDKIKTAATWAPWSFGRLAYASGYGAGINAPGWYAHLWQYPVAPAKFWLMEVARLLRKHDLDASPAHIIEAVRLADALAALRHRPRAGFGELQDAVRAVYCDGGDTPMRLVRDEFMIADRLGAVPLDTPMLPLPRDVAALQKRLRLMPRADTTALNLDLREAAHLQKSVFLHRLDLLGIAWGRTEVVRGKSGTFHELWQLAWDPEFSVKLIEANVWGGTLEIAANAYVQDRARNARTLPELTSLVERVLLADLQGSIEAVMAALRDISTQTTDLRLMLEALPPLANVLRYGNVRGTDLSAVQTVADGLVPRICIAITPGTHNVNDEAATELLLPIVNADRAIGLMQSNTHLEAWCDALAQAADATGTHPLLAGRASRMLFEQSRWSAEQTGARLQLACSNPRANLTASLGAAHWIAGFLQGSGALLVRQDALFAIIDGWLADLAPDQFVQLLPLLRRTFATFEAAERRGIQERAGHITGKAPALAHTFETAAWDEARATRVLPVLYRLFALEQEPLS
jgi:Family of unknown function (DUF5682)